MRLPAGTLRIIEDALNQGNMCEILPSSDGLPVIRVYPQRNDYDLASPILVQGKAGADLRLSVRNPSHSDEWHDMTIWQPGVDYLVHGIKGRDLQQ